LGPSASRSPTEAWTTTGNRRSSTAHPGYPSTGSSISSTAGSRCSRAPPRQATQPRFTTCRGNPCRSSSVMSSSQSFPSTHCSRSWRDFGRVPLWLRTRHEEIPTYSSTDPREEESEPRVADALELVPADCGTAPVGIDQAGCVGPENNLPRVGSCVRVDGTDTSFLQHAPAYHEPRRFGG
jgi:hypothetical protein